MRPALINELLRLVGNRESSTAYLLEDTDCTSQLFESPTIRRGDEVSGSRNP